MYHWHAMGSPGATPERDGFCQMGHLISLGGLDIPNLEFHEQNFPVRYRRWELRTDAAGAGKRRGGTGVRYEADVLDAAAWAFRAEGLDTPSGYGVRGGQTGGVGLEWIEPEDTSSDGERFVPPKYGVRRLGPADLSADMGYLGNPSHPEVEEAIRHGFARIRAAGKAGGIIAESADQITAYMDMGATFVAIGSDVLLFRQAMEARLLDIEKRLHEQM